MTRRGKKREQFGAVRDGKNLAWYVTGTHAQKDTANRKENRAAKGNERKGIRCRGKKTLRVLEQTRGGEGSVLALKRGGGGQKQGPSLPRK